MMTPFLVIVGRANLIFTASLAGGVTSLMISSTSASRVACPAAIALSLARSWEFVTRPNMVIASRLTMAPARRGLHAPPSSRCYPPPARWAIMCGFIAGVMRDYDDQQLGWGGQTRTATMLPTNTPPHQGSARVQAGVAVRLDPTRLRQIGPR